MGSLCVKESCSHLGCTLDDWCLRSDIEYVFEVPIRSWKGCKLIDCFVVAAKGTIGQSHGTWTQGTWPGKELHCVKGIALVLGFAA